MKTTSKNQKKSIILIIGLLIFIFWGQLNAIENNNRTSFSYTLFTVNLSAVGVNVAAGQITNTTSLMEYSLNSTDGTNGNWILAYDGTTAVDYPTGGFSVWIREAASPSNKRKVATIAAQASAPTVTINYMNETTASAIPVTMEYSENPDMSSSLSGSGIVVSLNPGTTYYFRTKATTTAVASAIRTLAAPSRPETPGYTINYINETTNEIVKSTDEYSSSPDMSYPCAGNGIEKILYPGQTLYFRTKATASSFKSLVQTLSIPARPATPAFTIDYINENTAQAVSEAIEYSTSSVLSNPVTGTGTSIATIPGQNLYFRVKAATNSFRSAIQELPVAQRPAKPSYSIDYIKETTTQQVSLNDEYAYTSSMDNPVAGTNNLVVTEPGKNIFFRRKATGTSFKSDIFTLSVPARPATPVFSISYTNETTNEPVSSLYEYSTSSDLTNSLSGVNQKVALTPGQNLYFRKKATSGSFKSLIQNLAVPARPASPQYFIDYINETTAEVISTTDQYSVSPSLSNPSNGFGEKIRIYPGTNLYFYTKATTSSFKSKIQTLIVADRPATPSYSINFKSETTVEAVTSSDIFSFSADMSNSTNGTGIPVKILPGKSIYFMTKATSTYFKSAIQRLDIPARPQTPEYSINYREEKTVETVADSIEYSPYQEMVLSSSGTGKPASIIPGQEMYFRVRATDTTFRSEQFTLKVPSRRIHPEFAIDYINEKTTSAADTTIAYYTSEASSDTIIGAGDPVRVIPGATMYFWQNATDTCFRSETFSLEVPQRPEEPASPMISLTKRALDWDLSSLYPDITDYEYSYTGENRWYACDRKPVQLRKSTSATSAIRLRIKASNEPGKERFNSLTSVLENTLLTPNESDISILIYPNPVIDVLTIDADPTISARPTIKIMDTKGKTVFSEELVENHRELNISSLSKGTYIVIVTAGNEHKTQKILKL